MGKSLDSRCQNCNQSIPEFSKKFLKRYDQVAPSYLHLLDTNTIKLNSLYNRGNSQINRLTCILKQNTMLFIDQFTPHHVLLSNPFIKWERAQKVFSSQSYKSKQQQWQLSYTITQQYRQYCNKNFVKAMQLLQNFTKLLEQICMYPFIDPSGLYRFNFYLNQSSYTQIIIDSTIPINKQKKYLYIAPNPRSGIWMILMEKALAKRLGSYQKIHPLTAEQIVQQITGFPAPLLYLDTHRRLTYHLQMPPKSYRYVKICKTTKTNIAFALWFSIDQPIKINLQKIVIQLIQSHLVDQVYQITKVQLHKIFNNNKIMVCQNMNKMIELDGYQQFFHFYNNTQTQLNCNLITQSDEEIRLLSPKQEYEKNYKIIKYKMIINQYKKYHQQIPLIAIPNIKLRFIWIQHRGIFCIKNIQKQIIQVTLMIKQQYHKQIWFQNQHQVLVKYVNVYPNFHQFFIVVRTNCYQFGQFYQLQCKKLVIQQ